MLMLNPSSLAVSNIEASIVSNENPRLFLQQIRQTLSGVTVSGIEFPRITAVCDMCRGAAYPRRVSWESNGSSVSGRKRRNDDLEVSSEDPSDIFDLAVLSRYQGDGERRGSDASLKRICTDPPGGVESERSSLDSCSSVSLRRGLSQSMDDLLGADFEGEEGDLEVRDVPDYDSFENNDVSYRSYTAKSERSRSVESLPILAHLPVIKRQISRTISTDEWDFEGPGGVRSSSFSGSRTSPMRDSHGDLIFRRTSIFAVNNGPAVFESRVRRR